jgi:hypothetical protein
VALGEGAAAGVDLGQDAGRILQFEQRIPMHLPRCVVRVRIVGVLDAHGPALAQGERFLANEFGAWQPVG